MAATALASASDLDYPFVAQFVFPQTAAVLGTVTIVWSTPAKPAGTWIRLHAVMPRENQARTVSLIELTTAHLAEFVALACRLAKRGNAAEIVAAKAAAIQRVEGWYEQLDDKPCEIAVGVGLLVEYVRSMEMIVHKLLEPDTATDVVRLSAATGGPLNRTNSTPYCDLAALKQPYGARRAAPVTDTAFPEEIANLFRTTVSAMAQHMDATIGELRILIEEDGYELSDLLPHFGQ